MQSTAWVTAADGKQTSRMTIISIKLYSYMLLYAILKVVIATGVCEKVNYNSGLYNL